MKAQTKPAKKTETKTTKKLSKIGEYFLSGKPFVEGGHFNMRLVLK